MDETMRLAGLRYLHETLRCPLETVLTERKSCEIDPSRVSDANIIRTNLNNLKVWIVLTNNDPLSKEKFHFILPIVSVLWTRVASHIIFRSQQIVFFLKRGNYKLYNKRWPCGSYRFWMSFAILFWRENELCETNWIGDVDSVKL